MDRHSRYRSLLVLPLLGVAFLLLPNRLSPVLPGGIIWHDLRRTFATRLRANGVHEYDISDLLGHSRPGVTRVYARATRTVLEQAVEKLTEPWGQVIEFRKKSGIKFSPSSFPHLAEVGANEINRGNSASVVVEKVESGAEGGSRTR